jgi:alpha-beta hydrolase superfamily lysophospholipase
MKTKEYTYISSSNLCEIKAWQWYPDNENVKAVIQIHHGMAEHCGRYKNAVEAFVSMGYAVFMNDMINHGKSNSDENLLGYFGDKNGYKDVIRDAKILMDIAKSEYPDKKYIISGHSMGSLVMRCFINEYGNCFDGAVFIGTSGTNPLATISIALTGLVSAFKGKTYKSETLKKIGFGAYDKPFEHRTDYDWGISIPESVDEYQNDKYCGFTFASGGYQDLAKLCIECNSDKWYQNVSHLMPVLLLSGEMDPVGNYTLGVKEVYDKLIKTGHSLTEIKIYPGVRHEILNEVNRQEVYNDINDFIERKVLN